MWSCLIASGSAACHRAVSPEPPLLGSPFWLPSDTGEAALSSAVERLRAAVASSLADGVLEDGFPRDCTVREPADRGGPFVSECVEGGPSPDGILLDDEGRFLQLVAIDFTSARFFPLEIYLLPDAGIADGTTPETLRSYPYVAIPSLPLSEENARPLLRAILRGLRAAGAESLEPR